MFRDDVVAHYRTKGYKVHEGVKVRGQSGAVHACDLIAQGPLGNLVVSFGDDGGFDGPEMGAVRRAARDVGATPVVAVESMPEGIRQLAARAGVVLLDRRAMAPVEETPIVVAEDEPAPWPGTPEYAAWKQGNAPPQEEPTPVAQPEVAATQEPAPPRSHAFSWLPQEPAAPAAPSPAPRIRPAPPVTSPVSMARVALFAVVTGLSAGAAFFGLTLLF